jgi:hypothetical protein
MYLYGPPLDLHERNLHLVPVFFSVGGCFCSALPLPLLAALFELFCVVLCLESLLLPLYGWAGGCDGKKISIPCFLLLLFLVHGKGWGGVVL